MLFPVRWADREQCVEIHDDSGAMTSATAQNQRSSRPLLDAEPHHRLVNRADFLDVERAVREPLAVEHQ